LSTWRSFKKLMTKSSGKFFLPVIVVTLLFTCSAFGEEKKNTPISTEVNEKIGMLKSPDPSVRADAASSLGDMGAAASPAVPFLVRILGDTHPVLSRSGGVVESTSPAKEAVEALSKIGNAATLSLNAVVADRDPKVRKNAVVALGNIEDPRSLEPLVDVLVKDEDTAVRVEAVHVLGKLGKPQAIGPLCDATQEKKSKLGEAAAGALGQILERMKTEDSLQLLIAAAERRGCIVRLMALEKIGELESDQTRDILIEALEDEERAVRLQAAESLGKMRDQRVVYALISALKNGEPDMREKAAKALAGMGAVAVEPLMDILNDEDRNFRQKVAWILGELQDPRAVEPLAAALDDDSIEVRSEAARALGKIKNPKSADALIDVLQDKDVHVREASIIHKL
jgi:HEAT repeat protein